MVLQLSHMQGPKALLNSGGYVVSYLAGAILGFWLVDIILFHDKQTFGSDSPYGMVNFGLAVFVTGPALVFSYDRLLRKFKVI